MWGRPFITEIKLFFVILRAFSSRFNGSCTIHSSRGAPWFLNAVVLFWKLGLLRFEPKAFGWDTRTLPLCQAAPFVALRMKPIATLLLVFWILLVGVWSEPPRWRQIPASSWNMVPGIRSAREGGWYRQLYGRTLDVPINKHGSLRIGKSDDFEQMWWQKEFLWME